MVFAQVNRVYLGLVERWKGSLTILRALSKSSKQEEAFVTHVTPDVTEGVTFPVSSQVSDYPPARPWEPPNPATRPLVPREPGNPCRLTAGSRHIYLPLGVRSDTIHPVNCPLTREIRIFNLRYRESGYCRKNIELKRTAKIKYRGPGVWRCLLGHQPRCVSTIRLRPPSVLVPRDPASRFEGPTRVVNEVNMRGLVHPLTRHPLPRQLPNTKAFLILTRDPGMRRFVQS